MPVVRRAFTRPASWRDIDRDYNVARVYTQRLEVGRSTIVVMGDTAEELHEKVGAAMLGYWHGGFNPQEVSGTGHAQERGAVGVHPTPCKATSPGAVAIRVPSEGKLINELFLNIIKSVSS